MADQLGEAGDPLLGVGGQRPVDGVDDEVAPYAALDQDRASHRRAQPEPLPEVLGDRSGHVAPVVDPRGPPRPQDPRRDAIPREWPLAPDLGVGLDALGRPAADGGHDLPGLVADRRGGVRLEQPPDLLGHGGEQLGCRDALRDERRHPPQRSLLVREPGELVLPGGGREGGGDELRELDEPVLDVVGQRRAVGRVGRHRAPDLAVDDDRGAGARADPGRRGRRRRSCRARPRSRRSSRAGRSPGPARRSSARRAASACPPGTDAAVRPRRPSRSPSRPARSARPRPAGAR